MKQRENSLRTLTWKYVYSFMSINSAYPRELSINFWESGIFASISFCLFKLSYPMCWLLYTFFNFAFQWLDQSLICQYLIITTTLPHWSGNCSEEFSFLVWNAPSQSHRLWKSLLSDPRTGIQLRSSVGHMSRIGSLHHIIQTHAYSNKWLHSSAQELTLWRNGSLPAKIQCTPNK